VKNQLLNRITIYSSEVPIANLYIHTANDRHIFEPSIKKHSKMATFLKYEHGLLIPMITEASSNLEIQNQKPVNKLSSKKIANLLIIITIALNTLLTIAITL